MVILREKKEPDLHQALIILSVPIFIFAISTISFIFKGKVKSHCLATAL